MNSKISFPDEIIIYIVNFCNYDTIISLLLTCKHHYEMYEIYRVLISRTVNNFSSGDLPKDIDILRRMFFESYRKINWWCVQDNDEYRYPELVDIDERTNPYPSDMPELEAYPDPELNESEEKLKDLINGQDSVELFEYEDIHNWMHLFSPCENNFYTHPLNINRLLLIFDKCVVKRYGNITIFLNILCRHFANEEYKNIFIEHNIGIWTSGIMYRRYICVAIDCNNIGILKLLLNAIDQDEVVRNFVIFGPAQNYGAEIDFCLISDHKTLRFLISRGMLKDLSSEDWYYFLKHSLRKSPLLFREYIKEAEKCHQCEHIIVKSMRRTMMEDHPAHYYMLP